MSLSNLVQQSKRIGNVNSDFHIFVSIKNFSMAAISLASYEKNPQIYKVNNGLTHASPEETIRLLYTIQHIVHNSYLGVTDVDTLIKDKDIPSTSFLDTNGTYQPRIEEYVERMHENDGIVFGLHFHFIIRDPNFNFNQALYNLFQVTKIKDRKMNHQQKKAKPTPPPIRVCEEMNDWVFNTLSPYVDEHFTSPDVANRISSIDFTAPNHPTQPALCLTLNWSQTLIQRYHPTKNPNWWNPYLYHENLQATQQQQQHHHDDDEEENPVHANAAELPAATPHPPQQQEYLTFPYMAHYIATLSRHPDVILNMNIFRDILVLANNGSTEDLRTSRILASTLIKNSEIERAGGEKPDSNLDASTRKFFWSNFINKSPEERFQFLRSHESCEAILSLAYCSAKNAIAEPIMEWMTKKIAGNPTWSICTKPFGNMDDSLSIFGNMVTREVYILEMAGVVVLHSEIALLKYLTMMSADLWEERMRFHIAFTGPPAAGKSFILKFNKTSSIPGTVGDSLNVSKLGLTTTRNTNGIQTHMDEANNQITEAGDGSGNPLMKSILSEGVAHSEHCVIDKNTGERISVKTTSEHKGPYYLNSNLASFMEAMMDRFYMHNVPMRKRIGYNMIMQQLRLETDPERMRNNNQYIELCQDRQFLSYMLHIVMRAANIKIDVTLSTILLSATLDALAEKGVIPGTRDIARLKDLCKSLCIMNAFEIVFFSGKVIPPGTPFHIRMMFECVPYLTITQEQFYFAITKLIDMFVDPMTPTVLKTINKIIKTETVIEKQFSDDGLKNDSRTTNYDYNYYLLPLPPLSMSLMNTDVLQSVSQLIATKMNYDTHITETSASIKLLLDGLSKRHQKVRVYTGINQQSNEEKYMPLMRIKKTNNRYGLEVLRTFLDKEIDQPTDFVLEVIKPTLTKAMIGKRIVTGQTLRQDTNRMYPYIYRVIDVTESMVTDDIKIERIEHRRYGINTIFHQEDELNLSSLPSMYATVSGDEDLDDIYGKLWCEQMGCSKHTLSPEVFTKSIGNYPDRLIQAFKKETRAPTHSSRTRSRTATTSTTTTTTTTTTPPSSTTSSFYRENDDDYFS